MRYDKCIFFVLVDISSSLTVDVTSMAVKDQLDITQSFLHFFISNFHETSLFMIYFDNLMKNLVFECDTISAVFFGFFLKVDISAIFEFLDLKFSPNVLFHAIF